MMKISWPTLGFAVLLPLLANAQSEGLLQEVYWNGYFESQILNPSPGAPHWDFPRFVLQAGYAYSDEITFYSELELEHAVVEGGEEGGELELEQAYLDFHLSDALNIRAGQILVPIGILNERHEPTTFYGVERNRVETRLLPTTWFDAGVGLYGRLPGGLAYKVFLTPALDATRFDAGGIREGRQSGSRSNLATFATAGRIEWTGLPGIKLGSSLWRGDCGFAFLEPNDLEVDTWIADVDAQARLGRLDLRALAARVHLDEADELSRRIVALGFQTLNPNVAEIMQGWYLEAGVHVLPSDSRRDLVVWARYEDLDTQYGMPLGFTELRVHNQSHQVFGLSYYPHPNVVFEVELRRSDSANDDPAIPGPKDMLNFGLGWWF